MSGTARTRIQIVSVLSLTTIATLFACVGCQSVLDDGHRRVVADEDKLHTIRNFDLEDRAVITKSAEEASADFLRNPPIELETDESVDTIGLSIAQCRALALENNLDLAVALLNPTIAMEGITQEEARFEATFVGNAQYGKFDTPTASTLAGSSVENINARGGFRIPLRTGGTIDIGMPLDRTATNNVFSTLNPSYSTDVSVSISQPLLRNAGVRTNTHAIRVAQYQSQITEARTKLEVIRVIANVDRLYWNLYAARKALEVRRQEYELSTTLLESAQRRVRAGDAAEVEIVRAQAGAAERVSSIIVAQNAVRDAERSLKRALNRDGLGMETATIIVPTTEPSPIYFALDSSALVDEALDRRMEMLELELQIAQDLSSIDFARNQKLPLVTLDYRYNVNGLGGTWNDSLDLLSERSFEDHIVGLNVEIPLGNQAAQSRLNQAILVRLQRLATVEQREKQIANEIYNAVDQLEANWQRVMASAQSAILEARVLEAELRQFDVGLRTSTDVRDAQTRFANARLSEILALTDYQISQVDIAFATGMLLGSAKVRWVPIVPDLE